MSTILELKLPLLTLAMLPGAAQLDTTHVDESRPVLKSSSNVGVDATGGGPLRTLLWFWAGIPIANKTDKSVTISLFITPPLCRIFIRSISITVYPTQQACLCDRLNRASKTQGMDRLGCTARAPIDCTGAAVEIAAVADLLFSTQ
jgi:hypothetical protein